MWLAACFVLHPACAQTQEFASLPDSELQARLAQWLPADVILLGEQHDAPEHQALQARIVKALAGQGRLAALLLEMADSGQSTQALPPSASEADVQRALAWNSEAWPWPAYGPAVMQAVRAGVTVRGANLPRADMPAHMTDSSLDSRLPAAAWQAQQQAIREGHCGLLPERQVTPMTRIQVGRDLRMAQMLTQAARTAKARQVVLLISGSAHADKAWGVPQHVPADLRVRSVRLQAGGAESASTSSGRTENFDQFLVTPPVPAQDYCAGLRQQFAPTR